MHDATVETALISVAQASTLLEAAGGKEEGKGAQATADASNSRVTALAGLEVESLEAVGRCGNGVCEVGEMRVDTALPEYQVLGCPRDCPFAIRACPGDCSGACVACVTCVK